MEFGEHRVETHARETDLSVVYTIDLAVVDDYINNVEQLPQSLATVSTGSSTAPTTSLPQWITKTM